jgi:hypothetical protein
MSFLLGLVLGFLCGWFLFQLGITHAIDENINGIRDQIWSEIQELNERDRRAQL